MNILILNRRDIANPSGGGAEIYTHEIARGLSERYGCRVVVFCSRFAGSHDREVIDGVIYLRRGNEASVHLWGPIHAVRHRKEFDLVIDEFNGIGFFTFLLRGSVLLIHQMYREFWFRELGIAGIIPYLLEPILLRLYKNRLAITVSESTKEDLARRGFRIIKIVMNALSCLPGESIKKDLEPTVVFLGRMRSTKRPEDALKIFRKVKELVPAAKLWMIGTGPLDAELRKLAEELPDVTFWGFVSEDEKMTLLGRGHALIVPSIREGFGINVIEAASVGTPAVGYNVPGLRDSIRHGETGYLADSSDEAASRIVEILKDSTTFERMSRNCLDYVKEFDWEKRVDDFWRIITDIKK